LHARFLEDKVIIDVEGDRISIPPQPVHDDGKECRRISRLPSQKPVVSLGGDDTGYHGQQDELRRVDGFTRPSLWCVVGDEEGQPGHGGDHGHRLARWTAKVADGSAEKDVIVSPKALSIFRSLVGDSTCKRFAGGESHHARSRRQRDLLASPGRTIPDYNQVMKKNTKKLSVSRGAHRCVPPRGHSLQCHHAPGEAHG
jgi:hypothetical protein